MKTPSGDYNLYLLKNNNLIAKFLLKDNILENTDKAINSFNKLGLNTALVTAENHSACKEITKNLKFDKIETTSGCIRCYIKVDDFNRNSEFKIAGITVLPRLLSLLISFC